jgi:hypothetical protein
MAATVTAPDGYIIDVCATCGRHAVYPFACGHRRTDREWTTVITVKPTPATRRRLQAAIDKRASDDT